MKTLIIDNYDSFTFNLYQMVAEVNGEEPIVVRNDQAPWSALRELPFDNLVLSPGPGRPEDPADFGVCRDALLQTEVPLLGVCLGHQGIGHAFGAKVVHAPEVMHGRQCLVHHDGAELFRGIPSSFSAVRYHSLLVAEPLPGCLERIAWTADGLVMGLRHRHRPLWGVQFHPESICTEHGARLLENFRDLTLRSPGRTRPRGHPVPARVRSTVPTGGALPEASLELEVYHRELGSFPDPERAFVHLRAADPSAFWLDSSRVEPGLSRFSFMGGGDGPRSLVVRYRAHDQELTVSQGGQVSRRRESIFDFLRRELARRRIQTPRLPFDFNCGFIGYFGYELKLECGARQAHASPLPDACFVLADRLIAFDHHERTAYLVCLGPRGQAEEASAWFEQMERRLQALPPLEPLASSSSGASQEPAAFRLSRERATYLDDIRRCQEELARGTTYEVCLTNRLETDADVEPLELYRVLRRDNPAPYAAFLRQGDVFIACSSPERFVRVDQEGWVESRPIKGTRPRGRDTAEDQALREELRTSEKDRAENLMIVDVVRNDLGRVCEVGSVQVPRLMEVETYATVHQLVSTVRGRLRAGLTAIDCVRAAFPGGSMTGAPKLRTMELLDRLEGEARGVYSGAIGYLALSGAADLNVVIRTAVLTPAGCSIGAGGAIVSLSDPAAELEETLLKARALLRAIATVQGARAEREPRR